MAVDKAGNSYWDDVWEQGDIPKAFDLTNRSWRSHIEHQYVRRYFDRYFGEAGTKGKHLLEIGAASSTWLPFFAKQYGLEVSGIDYSEIGCEQARQILAAENVQGNIVHGDLFDPPPSMIGAFDFIVSFGVVEHFEDVSGCLAAMARFLKPGGIMITSIPNLTGLNKQVLLQLNPSILDIHVQMSRSDLRTMHERVGLDVMECNYFLFVHFGVCNLNGVDPLSRGYMLKMKLLYWMVRMVIPLWYLEARLPVFRVNRITSPHIVCVAKVL